MPTIRDAVSSFYTALEKISEEHEELTDTAVGDALHETLSYVFVWGQSPPKMPIRYAMFSAEGDAVVAAAVETFLAAALPAAEAAGISVGQARLDVLQDDTITTPNGELFDLFIGQTDEPLPLEPLAEERFLPGDYNED